MNGQCSFICTDLETSTRGCHCLKSRFIQCWWWMLSATNQITLPADGFAQTIFSISIACI